MWRTGRCDLGKDSFGSGGMCGRDLDGGRGHEILDRMSSTERTVEGRLESVSMKTISRSFAAKGRREASGTWWRRKWG